MVAFLSHKIIVVVEWTVGGYLHHVKAVQSLANSLVCVLSILHSAEIFLAVAAAHPTHLRLKELIETVESARVIGTEIYLQSKTAPIDTIFDAACGHGLLGILLAYRACLNLPSHSDALL